MTITDDAKSDIENVWNAITAERLRQTQVEGWSPAHDDEHRDGELLTAAVIYLHCDPANPLATPMNGDAPMGWPWDARWWKPKDRRANLIRAGALCLAERDRCTRAGRYTGPADHKLGIAMRKLLALRQSSPPDGQTATHRHKKRGSEYVLIGFGNMQTIEWVDMAHTTPSGAHDNVDLREVAIYRSVDDGSLWVRPREEFEDGRFEVIPTPSSETKAPGEEH